jgi:hypothetical protein
VRERGRKGGKLERGKKKQKRNSRRGEGRRLMGRSKNKGREKHETF